MTGVTTGEGSRCIHVTLNNHRVVLTLDRLTGLEIKQEAAAQGAELEVGFHLSVKLGDRFHTVTDEEVVVVRDGQELLAIAPDDHA